MNAIYNTDSVDSAWFWPIWYYSSPWLSYGCKFCLVWFNGFISSSSERRDIQVCWWHTYLIVPDIYSHTVPQE